MRFWSESGSRWKVKQWPWAGPREAEQAGAPTGMGGSTAGASSSSDPAGNAFSFSPVAAGALVRWGQARPRGLSRAARVRGLGTPAGAGGPMRRMPRRSARRARPWADAASCLSRRPWSSLGRVLRPGEGSNAQVILLKFEGSRVYPRA